MRRFDSIPCARRRPAGFTLVELLVVVAIIAILASLLLPALARGKSAAHSARCLGNLRQLGLSSHLYVEDFAHYPMYFDYRLKDIKNRFWAELLQPYTLNQWSQPLYRCPGNARTNLPYRKVSDWWVMAHGSYDMNVNGTVKGFDPAGPGRRRDLSNPAILSLPVPEAAVIVPGDLILMGDAMLHLGVVFGWSQLDFAEHQGNNQVMRLEQRAAAEKRRHNGRFNAVFGDGHAEKLKPSQLFSTDPAATSRWNRDHLPHTGEWN